MKKSKRFKLALAKLELEKVQVREIYAPENQLVLDIEKLKKVFERLPRALTHIHSRFRVTFEEIRSKGNPSGMIEEFERISHGYVYVQKMRGADKKGRQIVFWQWQGIVTSEPEVIDQPKQLKSPNDQF